MTITNEEDHFAKNVKKNTITAKKVVQKESNIKKILKPHGVATWLLTHYPQLNAVQISQFCGLDPLKVGFLKTELSDGKVYASSNPVLMGYVTKKNLDEASNDPNLEIVFVGDETLKIITSKRTKRKYVSFKEKKDRVSAALWIINYYKNLDLTSTDIKHLTGANIASVKKIISDRKYALSITPLDPIKANICTRQDLEKILSKYS